MSFPSLVFRVCFGWLRSLLGARVKVPLLGVLVGLAGATAACRPLPPDKAAFAEARAEAETALVRLLGPMPKIHYGPLGTLAFAEVPALTLAEPGSSGVRRFVLGYRALFGIAQSEQLDYRSSDGDTLGYTHLEYQQRYAGVPVWGSTLHVHLNASGKLVRLSGYLLPLPALAAAPSQPTLTVEAARQLALKELRAQLPDATLKALTPDLAYLWTPDSDSLLLSFRVEIYGQAADLPVRLALFVDAHSGAILKGEDLVSRLDAAVPAVGSGKGALGTPRELAVSRRGDSYSLLDPTRGDQRTTAVKKGELLPGRTIGSADPTSWDPHGVDVHAHLGVLWDYFAEHHQHYGWDGRGHGLVAVVHLSEQAPLALFDGERVLFGDGNGRTVLAPGAALDVVAHEYAHAVLRSSAGLSTSGESGAVDEGLADLWACLIERTLSPRGNWTVGEEIYRAVDLSGGGPVPQPLRDLAAPDRTEQASHVSQLVAAAPIQLDALRGREPQPLTENGPRRYAAGIVAHAGYQLAQKLDVETVARILYRAQRYYLHGHSGFLDTALAMLAAASDLYGPDSEAVHQVRKSWSLVGVSAP